MDARGYGIIGCGRISRQHVKAVLKLAGVRLVAVADPDLEKAKRLAAEAGTGPTVHADGAALLVDPAVQVVVIASPTHLHHDLALAGAAAGKHIYCEKAMAASPRQCREVIESAQRHGVKLTVGQSTRFQPACVMARRLIDAGRIGKVFAVDAELATVAEPTSRGATDSWRYRAGSAGNGHVINFGCHYVDTARYLMGQDISSVSACVVNLFSRGMISEDQFCVTSTCDPGGIISICMFSSLSGVRSPHEGYTVRGTEGLIHLDWPRRRIELVLSGNEAVPVEIDQDLRAEDGFERLHRLFREAIERDTEVPLSGEVAMANVEWGLAAYLSSAGRRWVDLPLGLEHQDFTGPVVERTIPATRE